MPSRKPRPSHMKKLPDDFVPGKMHVICAKGKEAKEHEGNILLRECVQDNLIQYSSAPDKLSRMYLVSEILNHFDGFVRQLKGQWYDIGDRNAREKIGQALRDGLHKQFKSSTKAKACVRRSRGQGTKKPVTLPTPTTPPVPDSVTNDSSSSQTGSTVCVTNAFPVREVSFSMNELPDFSNFTSILPSAAALPEFTDLEPLALSDGVFNLDFEVGLSQCSVVSDNDSLFESAIDELLLIPFPEGDVSEKVYGC